MRKFQYLGLHLFAATAQEFLFQWDSTKITDEFYKKAIVKNTYAIYFQIFSAIEITLVMDPFKYCWRQPVQLMLSYGWVVCKTQELSAADDILNSFQS